MSRKGILLVLPLFAAFLVSGCPTDGTGGTGGTDDNETLPDVGTGGGGEPF